MTAPPARLLDQFHAGEHRVLDLLAGLPDRAFAEPCGLPGWRRADLLAHLARNADALGNLLTWARTGVETRMYPSAEHRAAGIAAAAAQAPDVLRADVRTASARLVAAVGALPADAWDAPVRTARDRPIAAAEVPWMRVRETWVHAVDLRAGTGFADLPAPVVDDLLEEVVRWFSGREDCPPVALVEAGGRRSWRIGPEREPAPVEVSGPAHALLAWLAGRSPGDGLRASTADGSPPVLPAWL